MENLNLRYRKEHLKTKNKEEKLKLVFMWVKQNIINQKEFNILVDELI